jgi:hypothetical protein
MVSNKIISTGVPAWVIAVILADGDDFRGEGSAENIFVEDTHRSTIPKARRRIEKRFMDSPFEKAQAVVIISGIGSIIYGIYKIPRGLPRIFP